MATTFDGLSADFAAFKADFSALAVNLQALLQDVSTGGVTEAQQAVLDAVDQGLKDMDATVKGFAFPVPSTPVPPAA